MPLGELKIKIGNQMVDTYDRFHLSMESGSVAALMTPPAAKSRAKNKSRLQHGERLAGSPEKVDSRELSLSFHITAPTDADGLTYYHDFCTLLESGTIVLWSKYTPNDYYKLNYLSCSSFSNFYTQMFKFTMKFEELNPKDRTL